MAQSDLGESLYFAGGTLHQQKGGRWPAGPAAEAVPAQWLPGVVCPCLSEGAAVLWEFMTSLHLCGPYSLTIASLILDFHGKALWILMSHSSRHNRPDPPSSPVCEWLWTECWLCLWKTTYFSDGGRQSNLLKVITKKPNKRGNYGALDMQLIILLLLYLDLWVFWSSLWGLPIFPLIKP